MLRLKGLGWGIKRIAKELGCSHMTADSGGSRPAIRNDLARQSDLISPGVPI
jgi:hypothetical protein